jgi:methylated-DNA-protein-cysteine methyltransferase-like protein
MGSAHELSFERAVSKTVARLRRGEVATYGEIAQEAGFPGAARAVGNVLASTAGLPWWRVVRADGSLAARNVTDQARRLKAEGVKVVSGKVRGRY